MTRSFVIAQISDLHLDGSGRLLPAIDGLLATIRTAFAPYQDVPDRILVITGDLVSDPRPRALDEALTVMTLFRQSGLFTDIQAVAGNSDVKPLGLLGRRHDVYDYLNLPRTSRTIPYRQSGLDLVLLDSTSASLPGGNIDLRSYHKVVAQSARLGAKLAGCFGAEDRADQIEPAESRVRVLALHHHPLPHATGEGKRFLGKPDEPMMYLASPATFLEAATSLGVTLILHGHRHVEGLTRYSIPNPRASSRRDSEALWRTVYVVSCPSSTGQGGDDAGFNLIHFGVAAEDGHGFSVTRYSRPREADAFRPLDDNLPGGALHLPAGPQVRRDPAVQAAIDLSTWPSPTREQTAAVLRLILQRRAFFDADWDWADALHVTLMALSVGRALTAAAPPRHGAAPATLVQVLDRLLAQAADVLGLPEEELADLRGRPLAALAGRGGDLPRTIRAGIDAATMRSERIAALRDLAAAASALGAELDLGGPLPPGTPR